LSLFVLPVNLFQNTFHRIYLTHLSRKELQVKAVTAGFPLPKKNMNKQTFRVGVMGAGIIFNEAHLPAYVSLDSVELAAIYEPNPQRAQSTREHYLSLLKEADRSTTGVEIKIYDSPEELIDNVDMIDICSPARYHAIYAVMALEKNVHVMTEKPMARTWWEARLVAEAAQKSEAYFQLNDDNLFIPRYRALRNVIDDGMIGEPQNIWIARGYHGPEDRGDWFWDPLENGGGGIMDYGSHAVSSVWFLVGYDKRPVEVRSLGIEAKQPMRLIGGRFRQIETDDDAHFKVRFVDPANGDWITAIIEATWAWPELGPDGSDVHGYIEVEGSTGTVTACVDEEGHDFLRVRSRTFGERIIHVEAALSEAGSFRAEIDNFVKSIQAGVPSILDAEVAATGIGMINSAQLSELRGQISITPPDLEKFSLELAGEAPDPWQGGDNIIRALYAPFRKS
jgi:predicted dehydrogenase